MFSFLSCRIFPQKLPDVHHELLDDLGVFAFLKAANPTLAVHNHKSLGVGGCAVGFFGEGLEEAFHDDRVDGLRRTSEEFPIGWVGGEVLAECGKGLGRVVLGIHGEAREFHAVVDFFEFAVELRHAGGDERAGAFATGEDEIGYPDFAFEIGRAEGRTGLVGEGEFRNLREFFQRGGRWSRAGVFQAHISETDEEGRRNENDDPDDWFNPGASREVRHSREV